MSRFAQRAVVADRTVGRGILQQSADDVAAELERGGVPDDDLDAPHIGAGAHHRDCLRVAAGVHQVHTLPGVTRHRLGEVHRLRGGRGLVEQRRIRDLEAGQVRHHRLEVEQRLEPALRDLRLVGRVRRIPAGILEHVAQDHARRVRVVVSHAQVGAERLVLSGDGAQLRQHILLALGGRHL